MTLDQKQAPAQAAQPQSPEAAASPAHRASWRSHVGRIAGRVIPVALALGESAARVAALRQPSRRRPADSADAGRGLERVRSPA